MPHFTVNHSRKTRHDDSLQRGSLTPVVTGPIDTDSATWQSGDIVSPVWLVVCGQ
jgi:hypothetical protein